MGRGKGSAVGSSSPSLSIANLPTMPPTPSPLLNISNSVLPNLSPTLESPSTVPSQSLAPSSHMLTPPASVDSSFEWIIKNRRTHPFSTKLCSKDGLEVKKLKVFEVEGVVEDFYLRADAFAHSIQVRLLTSDIDYIKTIIRTAPGHVEGGYQWPFENQIAKFVSKDSKEKLARDFEPILDGKSIADWKNYAGNLGDLSLDEVVEGAKVMIEYTPVPYGSKKSKGKHEGFAGGCTLKLHSITVLGMSEQCPILDISSPSKRRRLIYT